MCIQCWNCRGLGQPQAIRVLEKLVKKHRLHIVFLMETQADSLKMESIRSAPQIRRLLHRRRPRSGGLTFLWNATIPCQLTTFQQET
ncbi:hypothetical protein LINGRAHAP2_LOCUS3967 [Linum grandiflorum]